MFVLAEAQSNVQTQVVRGCRWADQVPECSQAVVIGALTLASHVATPHSLFPR